MNATVHPFPPVAASQPIHLVEVYYGGMIGGLVEETETAKATFEEAVRIVRDGDHHANKIARVIAFDVAAGTCLDVSRKVAEAIADDWDEDDVPHECLRDFLERHDCLPYWRDDDAPYIDSNGEHRVRAFETLGRR